VQISATTEPTSPTILELQQSPRRRSALCYLLPPNADSHQKCDATCLDSSSPLVLQGEELRKQIGAAAYIECSSKTQQVVMPWPMWNGLLFD
jgi:hypothetical protein